MLYVGGMGNGSIFHYHVGFYQISHPKFMKGFNSFRIGRRIPTCVFHIIAGVPLALTPFIPPKTGV